MNQEKINVVLQVGTLLAVLVGMGLVIWELQQTKQLMRLQLSSEAFSIDVQYDAGFLGEDANRVEAKACTNPESLTEEELFLLQRHFFSLIERIVRNESMERIGNLGADWKRQSFFNFAAMFRTEVGERFWEKAREGVPPSIRVTGDEQLARMDRIRGQDGCMMPITTSDLRIK